MQMNILTSYSTRVKKRHSKMESGFLDHPVWKVYHLVISQKQSLSDFSVNGKESLLSAIGPLVHLGFFIIVVTRF